MTIIQQIKPCVAATLKALYQLETGPDDLTINSTKPEFEGDYTLVLFGLVKKLRQSPEQLGQAIGDHLIASNPELFSSFNVIKGFLNLVVADSFWLQFVQDQWNNPEIGRLPSNNRTVIVEYSSPNTNKPLHLGHLRNNFLGWSIAEIMKYCGFRVAKTCIVNDRGIHICKSMLAWQKFGQGATPESTGKKGDHLVGDYYVRFENELKAEAQPIMDRLMTGDLSDFSGDELAEAQKLVNALGREQTPEKLAKIRDDIRELARSKAPVMQEAKEMLRKWEAGDPETVELWKKMNSWVYAGFATTYQRIGSDFEKTYFESETYLLGRDIVQQGLSSGVFYRKPDGSVWIDLRAEGLDEKLVMRRDGTSVYITQDIGLAEQKYREYQPEESIYVVGDEQNYHFKVLKLMTEKLGIPGAAGIFHLSYGMVELPTGKMKSREGTVVDADDLLDEMIMEAERKTREQGKTEGFTEAELRELYEMIGIGGLKFFLLRVDPKKRMVFNPEESIDLHGFTATFVQYTHARIKSILRKALPAGKSSPAGNLAPRERELVVALEQYNNVLDQALAEHNPSLIALYAFNLAKGFNTFYSEHSVLNAETPEKKEFRLQLSALTAQVIASAMGLLGIRVPERM